jgi:hypothetical protein
MALCRSSRVAIWHLANWDGEPGWWYVENGAITAQSTPQKPCKKHTYLIWRGGTPGDFELRLDYRLQGGNSGVQFRSQKLPGWDTRGYQADIDAAGEWTGALFEHARGAVAKRGQRVVIREDGNRQVSAMGDPTRLLQNLKPNDWNSYRIMARGDRITLEINGVLMADVIDRQRNRAAQRGIIALQLHPGPPMKIQFRNLRIRIEDRPPQAGKRSTSDCQYLSWQNQPVAAAQEYRFANIDANTLGTMLYVRSSTTQRDDPNTANRTE